MDHGKLAVLDLGEPGRQIGEKLFILLDAEQQRELTHYVLTRNKQDCASAENSYAISHTSTPQADVELPLTEIHEGDLYFCLEEREVSVRGKKVDLSAREFNTLYLLLMNRKRVMTFETIAYHVWDEECCEGTVATLNEIGIDGEWVLSGKEAVERAVKRHENGNDYFVYIIDWQMPGMDGIETTRQIRQKIGPDVSVIVLTSYDYTKIEEEAKAAGVDEFISKPLFRSRLTAALQKIISGKPSQDARDYLKNIAASDYTGKKILLVEDNELNREVAAEIIGMTGAEIETAVNGKEAVDKVADHPNGYYDLVFMDVQMPIMNGYEAATAIRSLPKHKGELLPIVAMTANAFTEDVILAKSAGMNEHIAKPLDMEKLNRILHEWM